MTQATIHQAKTHLSRLIEKALQGEEVIIARRDQPLVRLERIRPHRSAGKRPLGWASGSGFYMAADFNAPLDDFEELMKSEHQLTRQRAKKKPKR